MNSESEHKELQEVCMPDFNIEVPVYLIAEQSQNVKGQLAQRFIPYISKER